MDSIKFPDMFNSTTTNIISDKEATIQNLELLLTSEQGTLFGDPHFGLNLRNNKFEQNYLEIYDDLLLDKIYTCIAEFMPQLYIKRSDIVLARSAEKGTLSVYITAVNQTTFETDMYNIVLFNNSNS